MSGGFDHFVIFGEMRTGSNFLERNLNSIDGIECLGEAFNPHFVGHAKQTEMLGVTLAQRQADPGLLLARIKARPDVIAGFRFFSDHDPRVLAACIADRRCAKIVLTRNPLESYVSLQIARQTGQWQLSNLQQAKTAQIRFDAGEFAAHLAGHQSFQLELLAALQKSGQTAFYLHYDDIGEIEVLNGIARYLGAAARIERITTATKKQNPEPLEKLVENYAEMEEALTRVDWLDLGRTPSFEPRRGQMIPGYVAASQAPLLFVPIPCGPQAAVLDWMARLDGKPVSALATGFSQKTLRQWMRNSPGHRSMTVIRHPVPRLFSAFRRHFLNEGPQRYEAIRSNLITQFKLPLDRITDPAATDPALLREAFVGFAEFVRGNLSGQTGMRVDGAWASQSEVIRGIAQFAAPDFILREEGLQPELDMVARAIGRDPVALAAANDGEAAIPASIHDDSVETAVRQAYQRDYMLFGFGPWQPPPAP